MKKLVVKTISITLASIIGTLVLTYCAILLICPKILGNFFDGVGGYSASVFFYEKQYQKTGDIEDLDLLIEKLDENADGARAEKYYGEIIEHADFDLLCTAQDKEAKGIPASDYYVGNYCLIMANNGKFSEALTYAVNYTGQDYGEFSPIRVLIYEYLTAEKETEILAVKTALESQSLSSLPFAQTDLTFVQNLLNN